MVTRGNNVELIELQNKIHEQNKAMGWWDEFRSISKITNLNVSEISEAVEADRKDLMDDKLTKYKGVPVEAADGCMRALDYLGSIKNKEFTPSPQAELFIESNKQRTDELLAYATWCFSMAWAESELSIFSIGRKQHVANALNSLFQVIMAHGHNPVDLILEKVEYNKHRADHQRENRAKEGGKKH